MFFFQKKWKADSFFFEKNNRQSRNDSATVMSKLPHKKQQQGQQRSNEIEQLSKRIRDEAPLPGSNPLALDVPESVASAAVQYPAAKKFIHLPLSQLTQSALAKGNFTRLTDIQRYEYNCLVHQESRCSHRQSFTSRCSPEHPCRTPWPVGTCSAPPRRVAAKPSRLSFL